MTRRMPPLALLRTFEVAARHLSFKQAAAELHVTPAAVSQQIRSLETELGVLLFERLTRAVRLSARGEAMLPKVRDGLAQLADAVELACTPAAAELLNVTAPPSWASHWLLPRLPDFYARHPGIEVRLASSSETVDPAGGSAALAALARAPGELAVVFGTGRHPGWRVDALLTPDYLPVCAPGLASSERPLDVPADVCRHLLIHDDTLSHAGNDAWGWQRWLQAAGLDRQARGPGRHFSNAVLAIEAALAGQGIALAARPIVAGHLACGALLAPFPLAIPSPYTYCLVGRRQAAERPAVAAFRQWLIEASHPDT
ncbi:LysR family transcriptional regulator [Rubrivivax gelatinosus]|uniref:LysR family transcriptional regulator n=2 Tax=Rubrivivax gelatinosus TaxID=28068 RepID=A0ABS1DZF2_RUBGE|nr:LysR family transcriptional regulator [Rubrivivax gelatinosus]MBK1715045.1 LysR family transcriptional regulator [Rubrivivax gelatinosus]